MASEKPVVVVGAGLVGLAVARQLLMDSPGRAVTVVEKEDTVAAHQSGRNSGVIHSGVYYASGSIHAQLCRRGGAQLREFCADAGIPVLGFGKLIVATNGDEAQRLRELLEQARANGIVAAAMMGPMGIRDIEPHARGVAALHVPCTSSVDFTAVAAAIAEDIRRRGARSGSAAKFGEVASARTASTC